MPKKAEAELKAKECEETGVELERKVIAAARSGGALETAGAFDEAFSTVVKPPKR
ncbi:MAG: hypothetical protein AAB654_05160 [Acidobacteriota bacterium]